MSAKLPVIKREPIDETAIGEGARCDSCYTWLAPVAVAMEFERADVLWLCDTCANHVRNEIDRLLATRNTR